MVGGLSTVAGSVLVGYSLLGVDMNFLMTVYGRYSQHFNGKTYDSEMACESKKNKISN